MVCACQPFRQDSKHGSGRMYGGASIDPKEAMDGFFKDVDVIRLDIAYLTRVTDEILSLIAGVTQSVDSDTVPNAIKQINVS